MRIQLSDQKLATVLAALRYWQRDLAKRESKGQGPMDEEHFSEDIPPFTVQEIDNLCERLNCG